MSLNIIVIAGILLMFAFLLAAVAAVVMVAVRRGKISPGAAKLLAVLGVLLVMALFVGLLGLLKALTGF